jgi:hypothetical protein
MSSRLRQMDKPNLVGKLDKVLRGETSATAALEHSPQCEEEEREFQYGAAGVITMRGLDITKDDCGAGNSVEDALRLIQGIFEKAKNGLQNN